MDIFTTISSIKQAENSIKDFTNPADNNASLLIRLPEGKFVAFESACTHQGVTMNYDPVTHNLVCPRHGAIFDPANNVAVLRGPADRPLPAVTIHIQAGGTIAA